MKPYNLIEALNLIDKMFDIDLSLITAIEYEDGSGYKFNIKIEDENTYFIDLSSRQMKQTAG